jgi:hypothetical protein
MLGAPEHNPALKRDAPPASRLRATYLYVRHQNQTLMTSPRFAIPFAFLLLMFVTLPAMAVPPAIASGASSQSNPGPTVELIAKIEAEASAQKAQLTNMKEYHSSLLDTVYWALGTLAAVTTLLAGFGWFANFKLYEADKTRLKEDFARMLADASAKTETTMVTVESALIQKVDTKLDAAMQRQLSELQAIRTEIASILKTQANDKAALDKIAQQQATRLDNTDKIMRTVEANMRHVEEHVWEIRGIPTNKLITQGQALEAALKSDHPYYVTAAIARMTDTIQKEILPKGHGLSESMLKILQSAVAAAAKIDPIPASELAELLKSIPTKDKA